MEHAKTAVRTNRWQVTAKAGAYSPVILRITKERTGISDIQWGLDLGDLAGKGVCNPERPEKSTWLNMLLLNVSEQHETVCNCVKWLCTGSNTCSQSR